MELSASTNADLHDLGWGARTFASTWHVRLACYYIHKLAGRPPPGKEETHLMGKKAWMLTWAGIFVSSILCVYAAIWN
jgi:hypothetical protein